MFEVGEVAAADAPDAPVEFRAHERRRPGLRQRHRTCRRSSTAHAAAGSVRRGWRWSACNVPDCAGAGAGRAAGLPTFVVDHRDYPRAGRLRRRAGGALRAHQVELVVLAGFMRVLVRRVPRRVPGARHQHPPVAAARVPGRARPAPGARLRRQGRRLHGPLRRRRRRHAARSSRRRPCRCWTTTTRRRCAPRILAEEHRLLPAVVRAIAEGRVVVEGRRVRVARRARPGMRRASPRRPPPPWWTRTSTTSSSVASELTGLVAAALLARRGFRVLLARPRAASGPAFDAGRHVAVPRRRRCCRRSTIRTARVLTELDCVQVVKRRRRPAPCGWRSTSTASTSGLIRRAPGKRARSAIRRGGANVTAALERLDAVAGLRDPILWTEMTLPPAGFWERRELGRLESLLPSAGHDLLAPLAASTRSAPSPPRRRRSPAALAPERRRRGHQGARLRAGAPGLHASTVARGLAGVAVARGFETFRRQAAPAARAARVACAAAAPSGLQVSPRDETDRLPAPRLGGGGGLAGHAGELSAPQLPARGRPAALRVAGYRYAVSLLVTPRRYRRGWRHAAGDRRSGAAAASRTTPSPSPSGSRRRESGANPDLGRVRRPGRPSTPGPSYLRALRGRVLQPLARLWPFLAEEHLCVLASPRRMASLPSRPASGASTPASTVTETAVAVDPPPVYARGRDRAASTSAGLPHATGMKNLYLVGRENLPGLGIEGELISGWGVARLVGHGPVVSSRCAAGPARKLGRHRAEDVVVPPYRLFRSAQRRLTATPPSAPRCRPAVPGDGRSCSGRERDEADAVRRKPPLRRR